MADSYYSDRSKRPYFHWVERSQKGVLESILIRWPNSLKNQFFKKWNDKYDFANLIKSQGVSELVLGKDYSALESNQKSQIFDLAEGKRFVPDQSLLREICQMVWFNLTNETRVSLSSMTQLELTPQLPRELNPLFIERKFEYRLEKDNQRLISFLKCLNIFEPKQNELLLAYVICELIENCIIFRDKYPQFKIYLEVPTSFTTLERVQVLEIEDWHILPEHDAEFGVVALPESEERWPQLGRFKIAELKESDHAIDEILIFNQSFYHVKDKKIDLAPLQSHQKNRTNNDEHIYEGHDQISKIAIESGLKNLKIFDQVVPVKSYGISLENQREDLTSYPTLNFWTEFEYRGHSYRIHNVSSQLNSFLKLLSSGINYYSVIDRKDLAFYKKGLKRDNDLKILKHQGVVTLILLECSRYVLGQALSSGETIEQHDDKSFLDILEKNIFQLFKNSIFVDRYGEQSVQHQSLKDFLSDKVYDYLIDSLQKTLKLIKNNRQYVCVGHEILELENQSVFLAEILLCLLEPILIFTRADVLTKGQSKFLDVLEKWTVIQDQKDEFEKHAQPLFKESQTESELKNQYINRINMPDVTLTFIYSKLAELAAKNWSVYVDQIPLEKLAEGELTSEITINSGKTDWFELSPKLFFKGQAIRIEDINFAHGKAGGGKTANGIIFYKGRPYIIDAKSLPKFALLESFWEKIKRNSDKLGSDREKEFVRIPRSQILELLALADAGTDIVSDHPYWKKIYNFYKNLGSPEQKVALPESLAMILKDYQVVGTQWIYDLYQLHLGGILADDMGLGKTLQTLTFLNQHRLDGHKTWSLVVVPTSLCFNWENEARKFTPDLDVEVFTTAKKKDIFQQKTDQHRIIIVTYGLLAEHESFFADFLWDIVIFDEAQNLKNLSSKRTSSARSLKSKFKLALSGTPLENNYLDFFSLSDLVLPGSLGSYKEFTEVFGLSKTVDHSDIQLLKKKIKPIVLRRTKGTVNLNLPQKSEESLRLEFETEQMEIYKKLALSHNEQVSQMIKDFGESKSQLAMLTALLRLRQVCSDPNGVPNVTYKETPPKLSYIIECLKEHLEQGKSVIIFTQFIATLQHLTRLFEKNNIPFFTIHGSVTAKNRSQILDQFQNSEIPQVLLMTLKTGGVGLNLTKASVVYHVEPWWNPAVENQATDRVHRLGQMNDIQVYRLLMKDSVEEKIEQLKLKKKKYFDSLFSESETLTSADANISGYLSVDDFKYLLS